MANDIVLGSELGDEFDLSGGTVADKVILKVDGTSVVRQADGTITGAPVVLDNVARTVTFPAVNGGAPVVLDLSAFLTDIFVSGGSYDPATSVITLVDNDAATPDITIDLSSLLGVSADAGNILTDGADGKPFFDKAALDAQTEICTSVFGTELFRGVTI